jgi:PAS domain S-box-containing protein
MPASPSARPAFRIAALAFGVAAGLVVVTAMGSARPLTPWVYEAGGLPIPVAPPAALTALLLAAALILMAGPRPSRRLHALGMALLAAAAILNALSILGFVAGADSALGQGLIRAGLAFPRISPLTMVSHLGAVVALALGSGSRTWAMRQAAALAALVPLGLGGEVALSYLAKAPLLYGTLAVPMALGTALSSSLLGMGLLVSSGQDTWPMALFLQQTPDQEHRPLNWLLRRPLSAFLALALVILAAGSGYRRMQTTRARAAARAELTAIADQKAEQIAHWHRERIQDARQILAGTLTQNQFRAFLARSPQAPAAAELLGWMRDLGGYGDLLLFDAQGHLRLSTGPARLCPVDAARLRDALRAGQVTEVDLHPGCNGAQISLWVPIGSGGRGPAEGVLLLQVDAEASLFPMLRGWPTLSASAETLLVRRAGDQVLYLNGGRHNLTQPLATSRPSTAPPSTAPPDTLAAAAVTRGEGFITGRDYRNVLAEAALRQIPGTSWWMVAKMDEKEIFEPLRVSNGLAVTALVSLVLLTALLLGVVLRDHDNRQILAQLALERERKTLAERFQQIMHQANDVILLMDPAGQILEANARAEETYGYPLADLVGRNLKELRAQETLDTLPGNLEQAVQGMLTRMDTFHRHRDGTSFPVEVSARAVTFDGVTYLLSFIRDVTERHHHARVLQRQTQLYAALSQVNQAIVWSSSREELFLKVCQVLVDFGRFKMAWIGRHDLASQTIVPLCHYGMARAYFTDLEVHTGSSPLGMGPVGTALRKNRPCVFNHFLEAPETEPWHVSALRAGFQSAAAFPFSLEGEPLFALAVYATEPDFFGEDEMGLLVEASMDLTFALGHLAQDERRTRTEEALRQNELRLKALTESAPDLILTLDAQGRILYMNRVLAGHTLAEVLGASWLAWIPDEHKTLAEDALRAALATGENQEFESSGAGAHDELRWYRTRLSPIQGPLSQQSSEAVVAFATDITEARLAEADQAHLAAQLAQAQKLESLGSLAGGVAHDMNNVLGAILSLASAHRGQVQETNPLAASLDTIVNACLRGRGVVKSLLHFAHKDLEQVSPIDLNGLVEDMVQLLSYTTLKRVHLVMELQEDLGTLLGDAGALSNTLMNLCVNALDAMPGGGSLTLRTARAPGGPLVLSVQDSGSGMSREVQAKALEPFFTTKPQGKGTGLGLSMAYATMKAHGGTLEIQSSPGQGTLVLLSFPADRVGMPQPAPEPPPSLGGPKGGPWRILLVDDDELIRASVAPMLQILGHQVFTAPGGLEALVQLQQGLEVDLVILDMNMPGLDGAKTLALLLEERPDQAVLLATGYSDQDTAALQEGRPTVACIQKPFSLSEIQAKFMDLLR